MIPTIFVIIFCAWQLTVIVSWWRIYKRREQELQDYRELAKRLQNECYWLRDRLREATEAAEKPIAMPYYDRSPIPNYRFTAEGGFKRINED